MKKYYIEYSKTWKEYPMAFWVHKSADNVPWYESQKYDPPAPQKNLKGLYKIYCVEYNGIYLKFSSIQQYDEFIKVLSNKLLPQTITLSRERTTHKGPNTHWLSKLPAKVKSWRFRSELIEYLKNIRNNIFEKK